MLTLDHLRQLGAGSFPALVEACAAHEIDTPLRVAHFMAQCGHESGGFRVVRENLNYSAEGLCGTWPRRFRMPLPGEDRAVREFADGVANALHYGRAPERIANRVYAGRLGNGNEASGDGWRYRGRGLIQLTGRDNVVAFSARHYGDDRLLADPAPLESDPIASFAAADFWRERRCSAAADRDDLAAVTRLVNGGQIGLDDRRRWLARVKLVIGS